MLLPNCKNIHRLFLAALLCFAWPSHAALGRPVETGLKGVALVTIKSRYVNLELEQAVLIRQDKALFVGLDDFGGVLFTVIFDGDNMSLVPQDEAAGKKSGRIKSLLSLPLSEQEFLRILQYRMPEKFLKIVNKYGEFWYHPGKKHMLISFSQFFKTKDGRSYPKRITMENQKKIFDLTWKTLELTPTAQE